MKTFIQKFFLFILLLLCLSGFFQLSFEIFSLQGSSHQKAAWILSALRQFSFEKFNQEILEKHHPIKLLRGSEKEKILEFLKVDINHASLEDLEGLPRIGPSIAQRIIDMREHEGLFSCLEDLRRVKGLGDKSLEKLKNWIKFGKGNDSENQS
ncbi:MAG: ComEA family DNA-binding protein [Chlamydiae bacterium]|nr:ComEA family DNA-binding protein [Chlamydiota bacterium]